MGRRPRARPVRQPQGVSGAAEGLSVDPGSGVLRGQRRHDGQVRRGQYRGAEAPARRGCQASAVFERDHGGVLQGVDRGLRRDRREERQVQEDLRAVEDVPQRPDLVVPGRREPLRQLHDRRRADVAARAEQVTLQRS